MDDETSKLYWRFFRVTTGPLMDELRAISERRQAAREAISEFCKDVGAKDAKAGMGGVAAFEFGERPDLAVWRETHHGWWPRRNTKAGREMLKRVKRLPKYEDLDTALKVVGLHPGFPVLLEGRYGYYATLWGTFDEGGVVFVKVPWRDIAAEKMAEYKQMREAGKGFNCSMDHLMWEPPPELVEIREWEALKETQELRERGYLAIG